MLLALINSVLLLILITSTMTSFLSYSFSASHLPLLPGNPLLLSQAVAQQDGDSSSEPVNQEDDADNQQVTDETSPEATGDSEGVQPEGLVDTPSDGCPVNFALDPTTAECDPTEGPCPEGETRGESGFCAVMPEECPSGMYIDEDPLCEPCPTEGQIPDECIMPPEPQPEPEPQPGPQPELNNTTQPGNTTIVTINNAIAQAFSSTTYNTNVLQQLAQNTLLVGEETVPLQGLIKANDSRLLSTFDPFRLIGGSAIIYLPTSNISSSSQSLVTSTVTASDKMQILALDGDSNQVVMLPYIKMPIERNAYKTVLGAAFQGTNPFTGNQVTVDNVKALFLFNGSNQTITLGYGSSIALLTIVR